MSNCSSCGGCGGNGCGSCSGGCGRNLSLTPQELSILEELAQIPFLPVAGLEPARCRQRWILSPLRLPFHHTGRCADQKICYEVAV